MGKAGDGGGGPQEAGDGAGVNLGAPPAPANGPSQKGGAREGKGTPLPSPRTSLFTSSAAAVLGVAIAIGVFWGGSSTESITSMRNYAVGLMASVAPYDPSASEVRQQGLAEIHTPVIWHAPFLSGGGYCSEATSFALGLKRITRIQAVHHGDSFRKEYVDGLDEATYNDLYHMTVKEKLDPSSSVVVCHSEPGAWHPANYNTERCPPENSLYTVGRTMFETDRLPNGWAERINKLNETWVPTEFHRQVFEAGGVEASRLVVIGEPVDTDFYDPGREDLEEVCKGFQLTPARSSAAENEDEFKFLSVFKWEDRKGWRVLLDAFLSEFSAEDSTILYILTNAYHTSNDFERKISEFVASRPHLSDKKLANVQVLPSGIPTRQMPCLYAAVDAFVLPSRGEGWGRPHAEAMSMALPILATNWSGSTEFMTDANSYPISVEKLVTIKEGSFKGHKWAEPSIVHLRKLMRKVVSNPEIAKQKGEIAREDMKQKYCVACMNEIISRRLSTIEKKIAEQAQQNQVTS